MCLGVQQVVVYGLERRKINALRSLPSLAGRVQDLEVRAAVGVKLVGLNVEIAPGSYARMLFIRHPRAYFRWEEWGEVVQQFCRVPA